MALFVAIDSAGSVSATPKTYEAAMLKKMSDHQKQQGRAALELLDAAKAPAPPEGTGKVVNDVA